jgi:hypothetical protein
MSSKFYIDDFGKQKDNQEEYKLHFSDGSVFFILKLKDGIYYTAQLDEYIPIKEDLKAWFINEINRNVFLLNDSYDYESIIGFMFKKIIRDDKINRLFRR